MRRRTLDRSPRRAVPLRAAPCRSPNLTTPANLPDHPADAGPHPGSRVHRQAVGSVGQMLVAGFDGWKAGWVGIVLDTGHFVRAISTASLAEALDDLNDASVISVDIPMTMPQGAEPRPAERHAKRMLGRRSSTIFMTPARTRAACRNLRSRPTCLDGSVRARRLRPGLCPSQPNLGGGAARSTRQAPT